MISKSVNILSLACDEFSPTDHIFKRNLHTFRVIPTLFPPDKKLLFHQSSKPCPRCFQAHGLQTTKNAQWILKCFKFLFCHMNQKQPHDNLINPADIHSHRNLLKTRRRASFQQLLQLIQQLPEETFISSSGAIL